LLQTIVCQCLKCRNTEIRINGNKNTNVRVYKYQSDRGNFIEIRHNTFRIYANEDDSGAQGAHINVSRQGERLLQHHLYRGQSNNSNVNKN